MKSSYNKIHSCIPPEENFGQNLTFTFNPSDSIEWQNKGPTSNHLKDWIEKYHKVFDKCSSAVIECRPELSKLGRMHWHGSIKIVSQMFYLKDIHLLKLNGTFEIDTISDPMIWDLYCRKQQETMGPLCESNDTLYIYQSKKYILRSYDSFRKL